MSGIKRQWSENMFFKTGGLHARIDHRAAVVKKDLQGASSHYANYWEFKVNMNHLAIDRVRCS